MNFFVKSDIEKLLINAFSTNRTVNGSSVSGVVNAIDLIITNEILRCSKGTTKKQMVNHLTE